MARRLLTRAERVAELESRAQRPASGPTMRDVLDPGDTDAWAAAHTVADPDADPREQAAAALTLWSRLHPSPGLAQYLATRPPETV